MFHGLSAKIASQQLVRLLSSLRIAQNISEEDAEKGADLGSIFEIESGSEPPSTINFKGLSAAAVEATRPQGVREVSVKDLSLTFQRAMGIEFERLERTPFRPQVQKHSGKFRSFQEALQAPKTSDFLEFTSEPLQFSFSNWPKLNDASDSLIIFAPNIAVHAADDAKIGVDQRTENETKPSESFGAVGRKHKCVFLDVFP